MSRNDENDPVGMVGGTVARLRARRARGPAEQPWATWFERALGLVYAIVVVNDVLISTDYIRGTVAATAPAGAVAVIVGAAVLLGSGAVIAVGDRPPWLAYLTVTVLLITQFVVLASVLDPSRMPTVWWAWQLMVPAFVLVVGVLPTARAVVVVVAAVAGYVFIRVLPASGAAAGWITAVSEVTLALVFVAVGVVFVPAWRQTAVIADGSARARQSEFARTEAARAVDRQDRAASRLLHDEVIHALRAVALPAGAIEASRVRAMATGAADLLRAAVAGPPAPRDLRRELQDLTDRSGLPVTLRLAGAGRLPDRVVEALSGATGEALRNSERHAGCDAVLVEATLDSDGAAIRIVDDGRGFDPTTVLDGPLGLRQSILARVREVGGSATVTSTTGGGTTVELTWRIPDSGGIASQRLADLAGTRNRIVLGATMPILVFVVIQAGLHHHLLADPRFALLAVGVVTVLTVAAAGWVTRHPMAGWHSVVLIAAAVLAAFVGGRGLVPGGNISVAYFAAGVGAPALALIAMFRPPWESLVGAIGATAMAAVVLLDLAPDGSLIVPGLPAIAANVLGVVCLLGGRLTIDRMARSIRRDEELARHARAAGEQFRVAREVLTARLGRVRGWVLPFLSAVGDGRLDLDSADVRREAGTLEAAVRDDIRLGSQIDDRTRQLIAQARRAGRTVEIIADSGGPPALPPGLAARLLTAALAGPDQPLRTVLTVTGTRSRTVSLMVTPAPLDPTLTAVAADLDATVLHGPHFLLIRADPARIAPAAAPGLSPDPGTSIPAGAGIGWVA